MQREADREVILASWGSHETGVGDMEKETLLFLHLCIVSFVTTSRAYFWNAEKNGAPEHRGR